MHDRLPRKGKTARELAERTGLSVRTIMDWTAEPRGEYLTRAQSRREKIRELRATGLSMRAIASKVDCSVGTVHNALKHAAQPQIAGRGGHVHEHVHEHPGHVHEHP